jgi:hypothetical protein
MKTNSFFSRCQSSVFHTIRQSSFFIFTILFFSPTFAQLTPEDNISIRKHTGLMPLTGPQEGKYSGMKYVIINTVTVDSGQLLRFSEGSQIFFHKDAHIIVKGTLLLKGTAENPIYIGRLQISLPKISKQQPDLSADPHSLIVRDNAKFYMQNTTISDSTISINLAVNGLMFLDTVTFADNRIQFSDTTMTCPRKAVITCMHNRGKQFSLDCIPELPVQTANFFEFNISKAIIPIRIGLGTGTAAASALWVYYNWKAADYGERYEPDKSEDTKKYRELNNRNVLYRNIAAVFAGTGFALFTVTFMIGGNSK